jgi:mono/diheme cytochrome c family protein
VGAVVAAAVALIAIREISDRQTPTATPESIAAPAPSAGKVTDLEYVGSSACATCHSGEASRWKSSDHFHSMAEPTASNVLGDFKDAKFSYGNVTSTFFMRGDSYWVRTDGPDGKLADFPIKYTFGYKPLQQYLIELPGGRLQALSITWDARPSEQGGQRWFHQYPGQNIKAGDALHWTGRDQNWNFQCAACHSTNLAEPCDPLNFGWTIISIWV